jgi:hypothetical protein
MSHPGAVLQEAVFAALRSSSAVASAFGEAPRIYDRVPANHKLPYITIGDIQLIDDTHCEAAWEAFVTTHVWSEKVGKPEAMRIADAVGEALNAELTLDGFVCTDWQFRDTRIFTEPDGLTTHAVVTHRYLIDQSVGD